MKNVPPSESSAKNGTHGCLFGSWPAAPPDPQYKRSTTLQRSIPATRHRSANARWRTSRPATEGSQLVRQRGLAAASEDGQLRANVLAAQFTAADRTVQHDRVQPPDWFAGACALGSRRWYVRRAAWLSRPATTEGGRSADRCRLRVKSVLAPVLQSSARVLRIPNDESICRRRGCKVEKIDGSITERGKISQRPHKERTSAGAV